MRKSGFVAPPANANLVPVCRHGAVNQIKALCDKGIGHTTYPQKTGNASDAWIRGEKARKPGHLDAARAGTDDPQPGCTDPAPAHRPEELVSVAGVGLRLSFDDTPEKTREKRAFRHEPSALCMSNSSARDIGKRKRRAIASISCVFQMQSSQGLIPRRVTRERLDVAVFPGFAAMEAIRFRPTSLL